MLVAVVEEALGEVLIDRLPRRLSLYAMGFLVFWFSGFLGFLVFWFSGFLGFLVFWFSGFSGFSGFLVFPRCGGRARVPCATAGAAALRRAPVNWAGVKQTTGREYTLMVSVPTLDIDVAIYIYYYLLPKQQMPKLR